MPLLLEGFLGLRGVFPVACFSLSLSAQGSLAAEPIWSFAHSWPLPPSRALLTACEYNHTSSSFEVIED